YQNKIMIGFMPIYLQVSADPFGVLTKTTSLNFNKGNAFFSHIMHCYESTILAIENSSDIYSFFFQELQKISQTKNVNYHGLLNVIDEKLLATARQSNMHVNYMWDRFYADFSEIDKLEDFLLTLPRNGKKEIRR